jgi:beta-galactosidase
MRFITLLFLTLLFIPVSVAQKKPVEIQKSSRIEKIINSQWTFNYFAGTGADKGYEAPGFDDSRWPAVSIPHTWSTFETTGELHPFIRNPSESDNPYWWTGWGWYRKHFIIKSEYSGREVFIEFEGVQKYCKIWLNGKYLGDHKGGYGSFDFDITEFIKPGDDNVLAVAVNNRQNDEYKIPPLIANSFNVYGGIYRNVTIVIKNKLFIPMQGSASHEGGTFVTTPSVSVKEGIVRVQTWIKNDDTQKKTCTLQTSIADAANKTVQVVKSEAVINPGQLYIFDQTFRGVKNPHLWSNDDPYLYKVFSQVYDGKTLADTYESPLGFRWFQWDYKENFLYVNGKKIAIHGGNHQEEYPWLGNAIPSWITAMDYADITENLNFNFLKTSHYPNNKLVYALADKLGIVVAEESPSINNQQFAAGVQEQQIKEMIRRDRNHPSIMIWSMGSETNNPADSKIATVEDSTRILAISGVPPGSSDATVKFTDKNLLLADLSRCTIRGWLSPAVKEINKTENQQSENNEKQLNLIKVSGVAEAGNIANWPYQDYGTDREYPNSPLRHVDPSGVVDMYRVPKFEYYSWQALYGRNPMAFIQSTYWRSQYLGLKENISINTNCDKVELMVNGASKGIMTPDKSDPGHVIFNNVLIEKGTLSAVATKNGKSIKTDLVMSGEPAKIIVTGSHNKIKADRGTVVIVSADIVDLNGNHIQGADNTIKWVLSGPATLVGPSIYEPDINKHHETDGVWYMDMPVSNVIRSTGKPGKINISVSASGLTSGSFNIEAEETDPDNSVVAEPVLQDDGRTGVAKILLNVKRLDDVPGEIKLNYDELNLGSSDKHGFALMIRAFIIKNNPALDTTTIEFRILNDVLATQLMNSGGHLAASDYNFNVDHFNNCRLISSYISATKLPPVFKDGLKKYYSEAIIKRGNEKNAGEEMNWLNWIPSGGTVVEVQDEIPVSGNKGVLYTKNKGLAEIISTVYPKFANFSAEAKERALKFTSKMNPYVHAVTYDQNPGGDNSKQNTISYSAEKGQPILVPLLKFISQ